MDWLIDSVKSPQVWIGAALGIIGSLLAAYLKPGIDRLGSAVFRLWGDRTVAKAKARATVIANLRESPHEQMMMRLDGIKTTLWGFYFFTLGALFFAAGYISVGSLRRPFPYILAVCGSFFLMLGNRSALDGFSKGELVREARSLDPRGPKGN